MYIPSPTPWTNCRTPVNVESLASWLYCSGDEFERAKKWSLESSNLRDHFAQKKWSLLQPPKNVIKRQQCDPSPKKMAAKMWSHNMDTYLFTTPINTHSLQCILDSGNRLNPKRMLLHWTNLKLLQVQLLVHMVDMTHPWGMLIRISWETSALELVQETPALVWQA